MSGFLFANCHLEIQINIHFQIIAARQINSCVGLYHDGRTCHGMSRAQRLSGLQRDFLGGTVRQNHILFVKLCLEGVAFAR